MKHLNYFGKALTLLTLTVAILASCEKQVSSESPDRAGTSQLKDAGFAIAQAIINGNDVTPATDGSTTTVAAGEVSIQVMHMCGKSALERGYVLDEAGAKVYSGIDCTTEGVMWEGDNFNCDPSGFTVNTTLEAGSYAFRIKTNPAVSNNDPCAKYKCLDLKGVQTVCFTIVAE